jgi:hypothetical protein
VVAASDESASGGSGGFDLAGVIDAAGTAAASVWAMTNVPQPGQLYYNQQTGGYQVAPGGGLQLGSILPLAIIGGVLYLLLR